MPKKKAATPKVVFAPHINFNGMKDQKHPNKVALHEDRDMDIVFSSASMECYRHKAEKGTPLVKDPYTGRKRLPYESVFAMYWGAEGLGGGEIVITNMEGSNEFLIDTETMGKEFVMAVFKAILDKSKDR